MPSGRPVKVVESIIIRLSPIGMLIEEYSAGGGGDIIKQ